jgi:tRNA (cytidine/uridine-2'-O-)-methyltransferase
MKIVLFRPEIPQNTGNIGRLCVATETFLYLVKPLGFFIDSKEIRRSGLDYWEFLKYEVVADLEAVRQANPDSRLWFLTTKGTKAYTDVTYRESDILVFGSEGAGLPEEIRATHPDSLLKIPMWGPTRSLNLATAAGIVLYEGLRQVGYK